MSIEAKNVSTDIERDDFQEVQEIRQYSEPLPAQSQVLEYRLEQGAGLPDCRGSDGKEGYK